MWWTNMMKWRGCIQSRKKQEGKGITIFIIEMWLDLRDCSGFNTLNNALTSQVSTLTTFENFKKWITLPHLKKKSHPLNGRTFKTSMGPTFHPLKKSSFPLQFDRGNLQNRGKRKSKTTLTWMSKTMCWGMMSGLSSLLGKIAQLLKDFWCKAEDRDWICYWRVK